MEHKVFCEKPVIEEKPMQEEAMNERTDGKAFEATKHIHQKKFEGKNDSTQVSEENQEVLARTGDVVPGEEISASIPVDTLAGISSFESELLGLERNEVKQISESIYEIIEKCETAKEDMGKEQKAAGDGQTNTISAQAKNFEGCSSLFCDAKSEGCSSDDSGKGSSEVMTGLMDPYTSISIVDAYNEFRHFHSYSKSLGALMPDYAMIYEFEIPQRLVWKLIGPNSSFLNKVKNASGACLVIKMHPRKRRSHKICAVEGVAAQIEKAIEMIEAKFPQSLYPEITLQQLNSCDTPLHMRNVADRVSSFPWDNKLNLVEGVPNDVRICNMDNLNNLFVHQPIHPSFTSFECLHQVINLLYTQSSVPFLMTPFIRVGVICVANIQEVWYRAEIVEYREGSEETIIKLVDSGGYYSAKLTDLRQIRVDFINVPFQAIECRLANVTPKSEDGWSVEAMELLSGQCYGSVCQANVIGYADDGATLIHLFKLNSDKTYDFVNQQLVDQGLANWIESESVPENLAQDDYFEESDSMQMTEVTQALSQL